MAKDILTRDAAHTVRTEPAEIPAGMLDAAPALGIASVSSHTIRCFATLIAGAVLAKEARCTDAYPVGARLQGRAPSA